MDNEELRVIFAAFAMNAMVWGRSEEYFEENAKRCWKIADAMIRTKDKPHEAGIASIKKRSRKGS